MDGIKRLRLAIDANKRSEGALLAKLLQAQIDALVGSIEQRDAEIVRLRHKVVVLGGDPDA